MVICEAPGKPLVVQKTVKVATVKMSQGWVAKFGGGEPASPEPASWLPTAAVACLVSFFAQPAPRSIAERGGNLAGDNLFLGFVFVLF